MTPDRQALDAQTRAADWRVRVSAARTLANVPGADVTQELVRLCRTDRDRDVVAAAAAALLGGNDERVDAFLSAWGDVDDTVADWMNDGCHALRSDPSGRVADREAHAPDPDVRALAGEWLVATGVRPVPEGWLLPPGGESDSE